MVLLWRGYPILSRPNYCDASSRLPPVGFNPPAPFFYLCYIYDDMKYIITESKLEKAIIHFLNKSYGDLKEYKTDEYPNSIFYIKDKKVYMEQNLKSDYLWVDYYTIWVDLEGWFSLEYDEIQSIISKWVEESYNMRGVTPTESYSFSKIRWKSLTI